MKKTEKLALEMSKLYLKVSEESIIDSIQGRSHAMDGAGSTSQLFGVLKDVNTFWEITNLNNETELDILSKEPTGNYHLNSANTSFSNDLKAKNVLRKIR